jgi:hypothetical protein
VPRSARTSARLGEPGARLQLVLPIGTLSPIIATMSYGIFFRINGGRLQVVTGDDGEPREFPHRDAAIAYTDRTVLPDSEDVDYQIVELDEL